MSRETQNTKKFNQLFSLLARQFRLAADRVPTSLREPSSPHMSSRNSRSGPSRSTLVPSESHPDKLSMKL